MSRYRLPSYNPAGCCDLDCQGGSIDEPCWGECIAVDSEGEGDMFTWIHACKGHAEYCGPYRPPTDQADIAAWEQMKSPPPPPGEPAG